LPAQGISSVLICNRYI